MTENDTDSGTLTCPAGGLEIAYPSRRTSAARMRGALRTYLARQAVEPAVAAQVVLAADEAFINALAHAGGDIIRVSACVSDDEASVEVRDRGAGFTRPPTPKATVPDVDSCHGRGLFLIERLMDGVRICSGREGTTVRMVRRLAETRDARLTR